MRQSDYTTAPAEMRLELASLLAKGVIRLHMQRMLSDKSEPDRNNSQHSANSLGSSETDRLNSLPHHGSL